MRRNVTFHHVFTEGATFIVDHIHAFTVRSYLGSVPEPDKTTNDQENNALQRLTVGPYHATPTELLMVSRHEHRCSFRRREMSYAGRPRLVSRSAQHSRRASLYSTTPTESFNTSMANHNICAFRHVRNMVRGSTLRTLFDKEAHLPANRKAAPVQIRF